MTGRKVEILGASVDDLEFSLLNKEFQVGIFKIAANEEGLLLYANKIFTEMLNYKVASDFLYKKIIDLYFNPSDWLNQLECVKKEGACLFKNVALKSLNGEPSYLDIYLVYSKTYLYGIARNPKNKITVDKITSINDDSDVIVVDLDKPKKVNLNLAKKDSEEISDGFNITDEEKMALLHIQNKPQDDIDNNSIDKDNIVYNKTESKEYIGNSIFDDKTFDDAPFGMVIQKEGSNEVFLNRKLKEIFNIKEKAIGYYSLFVNYILPAIEGCEDDIENKENCLKNMLSTLDTKEASFLKLRLNNKKTFEYRIYPIIINPSALYGRVIYLFEATQESQDIEYLKTLSFNDPLTGINNRRSFDNMLETNIEIAKRYKKNLSLIMFDVDNFKQINDNYGHLKGDDVLKELAFLVKRNLRKSDILARYGGEEFMILCPETKIPQAMYLAEKIRSIIQNNKFSVNKTITCSFGVTQYRDPENANDFIERVDKLLYKAKRNGKNRVEVDIMNDSVGYNVPTN